MLVLDVNFLVNIALKPAVKIQAFFKCCLRICTVPIKQNICVASAACMQISAQFVSSRTKETDMFLIKSSFFQLIPRG